MDNNQNNFENTTPLYEQGTPFRDEISEPKKGFGIASLVFGIFGLLCCCFWPVGGTCAILALVFAIVSRKQNGTFSGLSIAGLVLAIIGLVMFAYMLIDEIMYAMDPNRAEEEAKLIEEWLKMLEEMGYGVETALRFLR